MLRVRIFAGVLLTLFFITASAALAQKAPDIQQHPNCKYCGMDREKFAYSRMLVSYEDGSATGTCSIHCLAMDLSLSIDKTPKSLEVGDYNTKNLIDAEKASWVIGGKKTGVMTKRAKWAFATKADAEGFIKESEGKLAKFDEAIKASYEDMHQDTKMIRERRAKKRMMLKQQQQKPEQK
jgi:nitrous oxide reductase accessory protein NosL